MVRTRKYWKDILLICAIAVILSVPGMTHRGMVGDDAVYSVRSIGLLDYMFAAEQRTPIEWFASPSWWVHLSFHDHPPLLFLVQHIFLKYGSSIFLAKLPFFLMAYGTIALVYLSARELWPDRRFAICASLFLIASSTFVWTAQNAFLDGGVLFFGTLFFLASLRFLKDEKYWVFLGVSASLVMLTKYTSLFFIGGFLLFVIMKRRDLLKNKRLWFAGLILVCSMIPQLIYNLMLYNSVGHFDLQLSRLFSQETPWRLSGVGHVADRVGELIPMLVHALSEIHIISAVLGILLVWKGSVHTDSRRSLLLTLLVCFLGFLLLVGVELRFIVPGLAIISLLSAYGVVGLLRTMVPKKIQDVSFIVAAGVVGLMLLRVFNGYTFPGIISDSSLLQSSIVSRPTNVHVLDEYLDVYTEKIKINRYDAYHRLRSKTGRLYNGYEGPTVGPEGMNHIFIYDANIAWPAALWLFERRAFYDFVPFVSSDNFVKYAHLLADDVTLHFIEALDPSLLKGKRSLSTSGIIIKQSIQGFYVKNVILYDDSGEPVFSVLHGLNSHKEQLSET